MIDGGTKAAPSPPEGFTMHISHIPHPSHALTRGRALLLLSVAAVAAVFIAFGVPGTPASAHTPTAQDRVVASIDRGTVAADIDSGRLSSSTIQQVAASGLNVSGVHLAPWGDLSPESSAKAADLAAHDASVRQVADSLRADAAQQSAVPDPAQADHWWNFLRNHEYYISGVVVKTIVTVGAGAYLAAVCITLDLSKLSCAALGLVVAGAAEFIKDGGCGQGYYFDFPEVWKSHCA